MFTMFTMQCQNDSYEGMFCLWYIILFIILLKNIFVTCFLYLLEFFNRCLIVRLLCSVTELVSLNASMSKNVFLESLNNMKEFHSNLYISNNKQELGFVWFRPESGMYLGNILLARNYAKKDSYAKCKATRKNRLSSLKQLILFKKEVKI